MVANNPNYPPPPNPHRVPSRAGALYTTTGTAPTVAVIGIPVEFATACAFLHADPIEVLAGFMADVAGLGDEYETQDGYQTAGSDEREAASEYLLRRWYSPSTTILPEPAK